MGDNIEKNLRPLFSGAHNGEYLDQRSDLYVHKLAKLYPSGRGLVAGGFNNANPDATTGEFMDFVSCEDYDVKPPGARDNDVHADFVNFVKHVARYHSVLDPVNAAGGAIPTGGVAINRRDVLEAARTCNLSNDAALVAAVRAWVTNVVNDNGRAAAIAADNGNISTQIVAGDNADLGASRGAVRGAVRAAFNAQCGATAAGFDLNAVNIDARLDDYVSRLVQIPNAVPATAADMSNWVNDAARDGLFIRVVNGMNRLIMDELAADPAAVGGPSTIQGNQWQTALYNHLQNWNSFDPFVRAVYNAFVNVVDVKTNNAQNLNNIVGLSQRDYRFNLKTSPVTVGGVQRLRNIFATTLPKTGNWVGNIYSDNAGATVPGAGNDQFVTIYNTQLVAGAGYNSPNKRKYFNVNINKFFQNMLRRSANSNSSTPGSGVSRVLMDDIGYDETYGRNNEGQLVKNVNGQEVEAGANSQHFADNATINNNCFTTATKPNATLKCVDYIDKCLEGQDIAKCQRYFASADFFDATQDEVENMLPSVAIKTLSKFGFKQGSEFDDAAGQDLIKVQSVSSWKEGLSSVTNDRNTISAIIGNNKLIGYLENLVQLINRNPAILNSNYRGASNEGSVYNPRKFSNTQFYKFGLRAKHPVPRANVRDVEYIASAINRDNLRLSLKLGVPLFSSAIPVSLVGGGSSNIVSMESATSQINDTNKYASTVLKNMFDYYLNKLKSNNKDIEIKDKEKVYTLIKDLLKKETQLYEVMDFVEKYSILVSLFGEDASRKVVSADDMKKAVKARSSVFSKKVKREHDLISVLRAIVNATQQETKGSTDYNESVGSNVNV